MAAPCLGGRFEVSDELGRGGFCVVHRGTDTTTGRQVAVKTYNTQAAPEENLRKFRKEVALFSSLGLTEDTAADTEGLLSEGKSKLQHSTTRLSIQPTPATFEVLRSRPPRDCFVNLLAHASEEELGSGQVGCFTVLELADYTLEEFLVAKQGRKEPVELREVAEVARSLAEGLAWIHVLGKVHLDVKPANLMRFGDRWKMIDMDGIQEARGSRSVDCLYTPMYASPEVARAVVDDAPVQLSRSMDMWSFGVTLLDMLYGGPALQETMSSFQTQMLFGDGDELDFFRFVGNPEEPLDWQVGLGIPETPAFADGDLRHLLAGALEKDQARRIDAAVALEHPLFRRVWGDDLPRTPAPLTCGADLGGARPSRTSRAGLASTRRRTLAVEAEDVLVATNPNLPEPGTSPEAGREEEGAREQPVGPPGCCCRRRRAGPGAREQGEARRPQEEAQRPVPKE